MLEQHHSRSGTNDAANGEKRNMGQGVRGERNTKNPFFVSNDQEP